MEQKSVIDPLIQLLLDSGTQPFEGEDYSATSDPAEIYEPVQTLRWWLRPSEIVIDTEEGKTHYVKELYCNVASASELHTEDGYSANMVATGRLTISSGVAYVDVG